MEAQSELLLYQTEDGNTRIHVRLIEETVWLSLAQIADLFQKAKSTISEHIANVFDEGELQCSTTVRKFRTVQEDIAILEKLEYTVTGKINPPPLFQA
jgi:hypothetical protein